MKREDCTILVCSCDAYEDTWFPFFKLLRKYWSNINCRIILNTETKEYSFDGLEIDCLKLYENNNVSYGKRIKDHLRSITTPFTLLMLDDFFIRRDVDEEELDRVIEYMKSDERAAVFNFQALQDDMNIKSKDYPKYNKRPICGSYKLNFQAGIWRTDYLLRSFKDKDNPWTWELFSNYKTFNGKYDFYVIESDDISPIYYGYDSKGMGIYRGKWVLSTVKELFEDNKIEIDYSIRGVYSINENNSKEVKSRMGTNGELLFLKYAGVIEYTKYIFFLIERKCRILFKKPYSNDYMEYLRKKERARRKG